jgi:hypothetical protein
MRPTRFGMIRATRQVLAVVAVTTALCADRVATSAPAARPHVGVMASRLVSRLAQRLRRAVDAILPWQVRQRAIGLTCRRRPALVPAPAFVSHRPFSPFQFRLPPPTA